MIKIEKWAGREIRFVCHKNEWWAVAVDVAKVLEYANPSKAVLNHCKGVSKLGIPSPGGEQQTSIIHEIDIYNLIFKAADQSRNKKIREIAEEFKSWVFDVLKKLREATGLEGFQVFRMLDKEHQKEVMDKLKTGLRQPVRVDYIKANTIANKCVSDMFGYPKMIKKDDMSPEMLTTRQNVLDEVTELIIVKNRYGLDISVSDTIRRTHARGA